MQGMFGLGGDLLSLRALLFYCVTIKITDILLLLCALESLYICTSALLFTDHVVYYIQYPVY